jgi:hypothetical protein
MGAHKRGQREVSNKVVTFAFILCRNGSDSASAIYVLSGLFAFHFSSRRHFLYHTITLSITDTMMMIGYGTFGIEPSASEVVENLSKLNVDNFSQYSRFNLIMISKNISSIAYLKYNTFLILF